MNAARKSKQNQNDCQRDSDLAETYLPQSMCASFIIFFLCSIFTWFRCRVSVVRSFLAYARYTLLRDHNPVPSISPFDIRVDASVLIRSLSIKVSFVLLFVSRTVGRLFSAAHSISTSKFRYSFASCHSLDAIARHTTSSPE